MSKDDAQKAFDASCEAPVDPRPARSIPKRKRRGRRIPRPFRPKALQISRRLPKQARLNQEQLVHRQSEVYRLRIDEGKTWDEIGSILGISAGTAYKDALVIRGAKFSGMVKREETVKDEHKERYDQIMSKWVPLLLNPNLVVRQVKTAANGAPIVIDLEHWESARQATEMILKTMRQREQLEGFHDPKVTKGVPDVTPGALAIVEALAKGFKPIIEAEVVKLEIEDVKHG